MPPHRLSHLSQANFLIAEDVDEAALYFWYSLGFRITSDAVEGELIDSPTSLNACLESALEQCSVLEEHQQDIGDCVRTQTASMPGGTHDMLLDLRCWWDT